MTSKHLPGSCGAAAKMRTGNLAVDLVEPENACWQVDDEVEQNIIMQLMAGSDEDDGEDGEGEDDDDDDDDNDDGDDDDDADDEEVRACCDTKQPHRPCQL